MATSGSSNFQQTRNELIEDAFSLLGVNSVGKTLAAEDISLANRFLNKMVKAWATRGLHLWSKVEGVLYLEKYRGNYALSDSVSAARWTNKSDEVVSRLSADAALSATVLTVESTEGMAALDAVGVVISDQSIHWTTIVSVDSSTQLTITTGLTLAASSSSLVFTYTSKAGKPLRIHSARRVTGFDSGATSTQIEIAMGIQPYDTFFNIAMSTTNGVPNQVTFNPNTLSSELYIWPRPIDCSDRIEITYERIIEDLDEANDDFDFPAEWLEALTYQLAVRLGTMYGKDQRVAQSIAPLASSFFENLLDWDNEITSVTLKMDTGESYND